MTKRSSVVFLCLCILAGGVLVVGETRSSPRPHPGQETKKRNRKQDRKARKNKSRKDRPADAKNTKTGKPDPVSDPDLARYAIYQKTAPRPVKTEPVATRLPLEIRKGDRIAFIDSTGFWWQLDPTKAQVAARR